MAENHLPQLRTIEQLRELPLPEGVVTPGFSEGIESRYRPLPENGILFVAMNSAAHTIVPPERTGQVYTTGLGGCTGIAGAAQTAEGALAGVAHFDPLVDARQRHNGMAASEAFIQQFSRLARHLGAQATEFVVAYADINRSDPIYTGHDENAPYDTWHFLRQLESLADEAEEDVSIRLTPYEIGMSKAVTIAASVGLRSTVQLDLA